MNFFSFVLRSFVLTPMVILRMIPLTVIYGMIGYAAFEMAEVLIVLMLIPFFAFGMFAVQILLNSFFEVSILRAGLGSLNRLTGAAPENLMAATMRHFFLYRVVLGAFGLCIIAIPLAIYFGLQEVGFLEGLFGLTNASEGEVNGAFIVGLFFVIVIPWMIVATILDTLFAVPMAANAASASARSPRYDPLFGLGRQFWRVIFTTLLSFVLPGLLFYVIAPFKGITATTSLDQLPGVATGSVLAFLAFTLICMFVPFSAKALAFTITVDENARRKEEEQDLAAVFGSAEEDQENLKDLRRTRASAASSVNVYDPKENEAAYMSGRREAANSEGLKAMRQARSGQSGVSVYDPNEVRRAASRPDDPADDL